VVFFSEALSTDPKLIEAEFCRYFDKNDETSNDELDFNRMRFDEELHQYFMPREPEVIFLLEM
jgi:hypothetical protein